MVLVRQFEAPAGRPGAEPLDAPDRGSRHEQLAPHGDDPGLDGALLVARIRVAEREREPIVRLERLEQAGQTHLLEPLLAAHARGVVEHDALGGTPPSHPNGSLSAWHVHSAFSPGINWLGDTFEYGKSSTK